MSKINVRTRVGKGTVTVNSRSVCVDTGRPMKVDGNLVFVKRSSTRGEWEYFGEVIAN